VIYQPPNEVVPNGKQQRHRCQETPDLIDAESAKTARHQIPADECRNPGEDEDFGGPTRINPELAGIEAYAIFYGILAGVRSRRFFFQKDRNPVEVLTTRNNGPGTALPWAASAGRRR
jgi:hypothetical protein